MKASTRAGSKRLGRKDGRRRAEKVRARWARKHASRGGKAARRNGDASAPPRPPEPLTLEAVLELMKAKAKAALGLGE